MTLGLYLTRTLALRILAVLAGLLTLGIGLEMLREAKSLTALGGGGAMARYAVLRLPALAASALPLAVLLGAISAFLALANRTELTVMRAAGLSLFALLGRLVPLAVALGVLHAGLADRGVVWSERAVVAAFGDVVEAPAPRIGDRVVVRLGDAAAVGRLADVGGASLEKLTIFPLDPSGRVTGRIEAERAVFDGDVWRLASVRRDGSRAPEPGGVWHTALRPEAVADLAAGARGVTAAEAAAALTGRVAATRGADFLAVQVQRVYAATAAPAVMLLFAALACSGAPRSGEGLRRAALGGVLGFGFLLLDGMAASLGRVGSLAPTLAAWGPVAAAAAGGLWALLLVEE